MTPVGLGLIGDLNESTLKYLRSTIQPTLARFKREADGGKFTQDHAAEFLRKAKIRIEPSEWPYLKSGTHLPRK